jgi:diaminopimelate epimerase
LLKYIFQPIFREKEPVMHNKKLSRLLEPNLSLYFFCIVAFAADMGITDFRFHAADGPHVAEILSSEGLCKRVRLQMKDVASYDRYDALSGVMVPSEGCFLDTGTRHYVRIVEGLDGYDVVGEGRDIRYHAAELQPVGANVNFIEPSGNVLKVRTYEKGVEDETFACGTGIVASCIAAYKAGISPSEVISDGRVRYDVKAKRDSLSVDFRPVSGKEGVAEDVYLTGPATFVAEVSVAL